MNLSNIESVFSYRSPSVALFSAVEVHLVLQGLLLLFFGVDATLGEVDIGTRDGRPGG